MTVRPASSSQLPTVLVVSSDPARLRLVAHSLQLEFDVVVASDVRSAALQLIQTSPCVVLTDLEVAGVRGATFVRWLRQRKKTMPVAVLGDGESTHAVLAIQSGANALLQSPFRPVDLLERVRRLVRRSSWPAALPRSA